MVDVPLKPVRAAGLRDKSESRALCFRAVICAGDFLADDVDSCFNRGGILGVGYADAFMSMPPFALETGKKMLSGNDQDTTTLEPLIKLFAGDRQAFKP